MGNPGLDAFANLGHNLMAIYDKAGRQFVFKAFDLESGEELSLTSFSGDLPATHPFLAHDNHKSSVSGVIKTEHGLMLVASRPIVQSSGEDPVVGAFVMGRLLTDAAIAELQEQTHLRFTISAVSLAALPAGLRHPDSTSSAGDISYDDTDSRIIETLQAFAMLDSGLVAVIRTETPREITAIGRATLRVVASISIVAGFMIMIALWLLLSRLIVRSLVTLKDHVLSVGQTGLLAQRAPVIRDDEIGVLARQFDTTFDQLADLRLRLLEQSHYSGMAEIASGVVHNLRNALSPVSVSLGQLLRKTSEPLADNFRKAYVELCDENTPADRRQKLMQFVNLVVEKLAQDRHDISRELQQLVAHNGQIEQILGDHDQFSRSARRLEPVNLADVITASASLVTKNRTVPIELIIEPAIGEMPPVVADPILLAQIFTNLLVNAAEAIEASQNVAGTIEVGAVRQFRDGREVVRILVRDNGKGIDQDTLDKIFDRGFSTKRGKSGGIGLHWCANSLAGMTGAIHAESAGPQRGATFSVILPAASIEKEAAA